jgi:hypothetical protein
MTRYQHKPTDAVHLQMENPQVHQVLIVQQSAAGQVTLLHSRHYAVTCVDDIQQVIPFSYTWVPQVLKNPD